MRNIGIHEFVLMQVDEKYAPPAQPVLRVAVMGDVVSFSFDRIEEDTKSLTYTNIDSVIVDLEPLMNGLAAAVLSRGQKSD